MGRLSQSFLSPPAISNKTLPLDIALMMVKNFPMWEEKNLSAKKKKNPQAQVFVFRCWLSNNYPSSHSCLGEGEENSRKGKVFLRMHEICKWSHCYCLNLNPLLFIRQFHRQHLLIIIASAARVQRLKGSWLSLSDIQSKHPANSGLMCGKRKFSFRISLSSLSCKFCSLLRFLGEISIVWKIFQRGDVRRVDFRFDEKVYCLAFFPPRRKTWLHCKLLA